MVFVCICVAGSAATKLQKAEVRIINSTVCNDLMKGQITSRMTCAGILAGGVDACQVSFIHSFIIYPLKVLITSILCFYVQKNI